MKTNKEKLTSKFLIKLFCISLAFMFPLLKGAGVCYAQNIGINTTGATPNAKALLDIDAGVNNLGLLIPRLTTAQRNAITAPIPESLLIYNTTTQCFEAWNNTTSTWVAFGCIGCQLPGAFTATSATNIAQTAFDANWTASAAATAYYLDVSTASNFSTFVTGYNNLNVGNVLTLSVTGLTCGTAYYYRIRAENSCGTSANSNTITVTTSACITTIVYATPGVYDFTVPAGITSLTVKVWGAGGNATNANARGGGGGYVQGVLTVTPGQLYKVSVGSPTGGGVGGTATGGIAGAPFGGPGSNGGGLTGLFLTSVIQGNAMFIAGSGGGGGGVYQYTGGSGGAGGNNSGGTGISSPSGGTAGGGIGGNQSAGGAGGVAGGGGSAGNSGAVLLGGAGANQTGDYPHGGGGGGSGYYGGGGAGSSNGLGNGGSGGGGGGSNFIVAGATSTVNLQATAAGNGITGQPPNQGDADYIAGHGVGDGSGTGLIVIIY